MGTAKKFSVLIIIIILASLSFYLLMHGEDTHASLTLPPPPIISTTEFATYLPPCEYNLIVGQRSDIPTISLGKLYYARCVIQSPYRGKPTINPNRIFALTAGKLEDTLKTDGAQITKPEDFDHPLLYKSGSMRALVNKDKTSVLFCGKCRKRDTYVSFSKEERLSETEITNVLKVKRTPDYRVFDNICQGFTFCEGIVPSEEEFGSNMWTFYNEEPWERYDVVFNPTLNYSAYQLFKNKTYLTKKISAGDLYQVNNRVICQHSKHCIILVNERIIVEVQKAEINTDSDPIMKRLKDVKDR